MYEMLTGVPPFSTENRSELFDLIRYGVIEYPEGVSTEGYSGLTKVAGLAGRAVQKKSEGAAWL